MITVLFLAGFARWVQRRRARRKSDLEMAEDRRELVDDRYGDDDADTDGLPTALNT